MAEALKIEIAGKKFLLKSREGGLPGVVRNLPDDFKKEIYSDALGLNPDYSIMFHRKKNSLFTLPKDDNMSSNIEIREDNGGFNIVLKSKPEVSIGRVYPDESRADFFVYSPALNRDYFIPFLRNAFQFFIAGAGEFILHASAIVENDEGMIFTGASGAGKTTISNFYPKDAVLSDEFICLRKIKGEYFISSTPWRSRNLKTCKLAKIIFPEKSKELKIVKEKPGSAICKIMPNILHMPGNFKISENILNFLLGLTEKIPCYTMRFPKNKKFMKVL